jgi:hypothetical protein
MTRRALSPGAGHGASRMQMPEVARLVRGAAVLTLMVTLLRLWGERRGWSETFFSRDPGGAGALIGIVWLVLFFGFFFGWKLAQIEYRPPGTGRVLGFCLAAIGVVVVTLVIAGALGVGPVGRVVAVCIASIVAAGIGLRAWPELGTVLMAYGLSARIPVVLVMFFAMRGQWGTHYDAVPPGWPPGMGFWPQFLLLAVLPQLTLWMAFTIVVGTLFGLPGVWLSRKSTQIEVGQEILAALEQRRKGKVRQ